MMPIIPPGPQSNQSIHDFSEVSKHDASVMKNRESRIVRLKRLKDLREKLRARAGTTTSDPIS